MATPKTWTATDLQMGKLMLDRGAGELHIDRQYTFTDSSGSVIAEISTGRVVETVPIAQVPANILTALQEIDDWTYQKALQQEGMT